MRLRWVKLIYTKEILETLRDRRTLFMMVALPILLYPLLFLGVGAAMQSHVAKLEDDTVRVALLGNPPPPLTEALEGADDGKLEVIEPEPPKGADGVCEVARRWLLDKTVEAVVVAGEQAGSCGRPEWDNEVGQDAPLGRFDVLFDGANDMSGSASRRMRESLEQMEREVLAERLAQGGLDPALARPFALSRTNLAGEQRMGGHFAGRILPMILVLMVILGAFYPAIDLTAGEKERGTLETLISSPVRPGEIVAGKYLTVVTMALIAATVNLASMALTIDRMASGLPSEIGGSFSLSLGGTLTVLLLLVPTAMFFGALMLTIAVLARDFKEAQNLLTPAYMVCVLPAAIAGMPGVELNWATTFAPAINITLVIKDVLTDSATAEAVFAVLLANSVYATLVLVVASRLFSSEHVMFGTGQPWKGWRSLLGGRLLAGLKEPAEPGRTMTPGGTLLLFAVLLVLLYYIASALQAADVVSGLLITEWVILLGPAILVPWLARHDLRETFSLRGMSWRALLAALLVGVSAWTLAVGASALTELVLPVPKAYVEAMKEFFQVGDLPAWWMLLLIAVSPAICEEAVFRGVILSGMRNRLGRWPAIVVVGLLFGAFHLSIYRLLPTAVLGMVITFAVWQTRSIWAGVLIHGISNGLVFSASTFPTLGNLLGIEDGDMTLGWQLPVFVALLALGLWLLWREAPNATRWEPLPTAGSAVNAHQGGDRSAG